ncbi:hypothetical protein, partial [Kocuria rhizophila]|uniref:hypothetical protein n=1 Tax=Kocuria rhizophila TaxID=72000 RepID=UPI001C92FD7E
VGVVEVVHGVEQDGETVHAEGGVDVVVGEGVEGGVGVDVGDVGVGVEEVVEGVGVEEGAVEGGDAVEGEAVGVGWGG